MTVLRMASWALLVAMFAFAIGTYSSLPAQIPTGINADGLPRGMTEKSLLTWMLVPGLALIIHASMVWIREALPKKPEMFNFSEKERFLRLPASYRVPVVAEMQTTVDLISPITIVTLLFVQYLMWQAASGNRVQGAMLALVVGSVMITPVILIIASRVSNATEEAEKRWKADGSPAETVP